jgi:hypothetical protein
MSLKEDYRDDIEKSPKELEREIDETRLRMERTLDMLERKLSPSDMFEEAFRVVRRNGGAFASNLSAEVQNKPLPALLAGVGLAWLMTGSDSPPQYRSGSGLGSRFGQRAREGAHDASERAHQMGDRAHEMGDRFQQRAHDMGERFQDMGRRAGDAASRAGEGMHERAERLRHAAQRGGQRAREEYQHLLQEQPLLLGGLGLALGAALGAMVPRTETEDRLMGEHSDRAKEEVKDKAQRASQEARESAERVAGAAQEQMSRERQERSREHQQGKEHYQGSGDQQPRSREHDGGSRYRPS